MDRSFLFITCQVDAEGAVKREMPFDYRLAFSRPGFLTFKLPAEHTLADDFALNSVFARAYGFSLGKVTSHPVALPAKGQALAQREPATGDTHDTLARQVWRLVGERHFDQVHVWPRDTAAPGVHGFQPGITLPALETAEAISRVSPTGQACNQVARPGDLVLDCIVVEPHEWWIGYHRARLPASCVPGGFWPLELPADAVSRAYLKMEEALLWSQLPVKAGDRIVEIGSSPGGASQALLNRGLLVTGIDPAEIDERVLSHPNFTHIQKRGHEVRRREFRKMRWLAADMNVPPEYTLDTVEAIVTHPEVRIRGLLLTLKLPDWDLAAEVPAYLKRIRSWGYPEVRARQLQHHRQEICVAAQRARPRSASGRGGAARRGTRFRAP
jgi:23S rRNA (cytidine2498-2'-O)-methyltransferase